MSLLEFIKSLAVKLTSSSANRSFEAELNLLNELVFKFSIGECSASRLVKQINKFEFDDEALEDFLHWLNLSLSSTIESSVPVLALKTGKPVAGCMPRINGLDGLNGAEKEIKSMLKDNELKELVKSNYHGFFVNCVVGDNLFKKAGGVIPKLSASSVETAGYELEAKKLQDAYRKILSTRYYENDTKDFLINNVIVGNIFSRCVSSGDFDQDSFKNEYFNKHTFTDAQISSLIGLIDARVIENLAKH